jgi:hypothetical protein
LKLYSLPVGVVPVAAIVPVFWIYPILQAVLEEESICVGTSSFVARYFVLSNFTN